MIEKNTPKIVLALMLVFVLSVARAVPRKRFDLFDLHADTIKNGVDSSKQIDAYDILGRILHSKHNSGSRTKARRLIFAIVPSAGYTLTTGFAVDVTGNVAFYTIGSHQQNLSTIYEELIYDTNNQKISIIRSNIWFGDNKYNLVSDVRWERFPELTYGLGTMTDNNKSDNIDYEYIKLYPTLYRRIAGNYYVGAGYNLDYHYGITEVGNVDGTVSDFQKYGRYSTSSSSGVNVDFLYDSRKNSINPLGGSYASLILRQNATFLGSNSGWQSLFFDYRKYYKLSDRSNNILAFWSMVWLTRGNVPYLDLPSTGTDMYNNSGRGYAEGRFRGKDMLYLEGEYRFGITHNGFIGGVVFANGEGFTEYATNSFKRIAPAAGAGIRLKVNKHSNTNVCFDYAIGAYGSKGLFVNLGEVF
jgi:hypothetical protein